jgi:hypothetical protein
MSITSSLICVSTCVVGSDFEYDGVLVIVKAVFCWLPSPELVRLYGPPLLRANSGGQKTVRAHSAGDASN